MPPSSMILVADLGNQLLKLGQVVGDRIEASHCLEITDQVRDGGFSPSQMPEAVVYASVNPARDQVFDDWIARRFSLNARKLGRDLPIPIRTRCSGVGADRLLNALAAVRRFPGGAIVVDVGTAVTVDVVSPEEEFLGGAIFPGPHLGAWALAEKAAQLFHVDPVPPVQAIATETAEAIRSGLFHSIIGGVNHLVSSYTGGVGFDPTLVMTGGDSSLILDHFPGAEHCPLLTLEGIVKCL